MQYESVILELLERIKQLETSYENLENRLSCLENQADRTSNGAIAEEETEQPEAEPELRKKMTPEMMAACYECANQLHHNAQLSFGHTMDDLVEQTGMNRNSAIMYVYAVKSMLAGEGYKRAISQPATELFFNLILRDYGPEGLQKALTAARTHITYRQQYGHIVDGLEKLCEAYETKLKQAAR